MKFIAHRRNTLSELLATPKSYGVEVDIRSSGDLLVTQHEPYLPGTDFRAWLDEFDHRTLILNVKEEGLEARLLDILKDRGIEDFFFLDQSFPFLVKWARAGESRAAVRVSEYESVETALALAGMCDWVWVDCFTRMPLSFDEASRLKEAGFSLCLVSPELQGRDPNIHISAMHADLVDRGIEVDAVCTKRPDLWFEVAG